MIAGQFVKGKIDGIQKYFKTANLRDILPKNRQDELEKHIEVGEYPHFFKAEKIIAKTRIINAENTDGRRGGIINHTVVYRFDPTVTKDSINYIFPLDDFIKEYIDGKRSFKMPSMPTLPDTDAGLIDAPPPIAWEV
jgi:hypothetical protein